MLTRATVAIALVAAACGGSTADLTDLAGNTGRREVLGSKYGAVLPELTPELTQHQIDGRTEFVRNRSPSAGLGPVMTGISCQACHDGPPAEGGTNQRLETRFGRRGANGVFDPLLSLGGPLLQDQGIGNVNGVNWVAEKVPVEANVVAGR